MKIGMILILLTRLVWVTPPVLARYAVTLRWDAPTTFTDGSPAGPEDIGGYHLSVGLAPGQYTLIRDVGPTTQFTLADLADGTPYYVVVSAYDLQQVESAPSAPELRLEPPPVPPLADTTAPTVLLTTPVTGERVPRKGTVRLEARAQDDVGVVRVAFFVEGTLLCTVQTPPYTCAWTVPAANKRTYQLQAKAYDAAANVGVSSVVTVTAN